MFTLKQHTLQAGRQCSLFHQLYCSVALLAVSWSSSWLSLVGMAGVCWQSARGCLPGSAVLHGAVPGAGRQRAAAWPCSGSRGALHMCCIMPALITPAAIIKFCMCLLLQSPSIAVQYACMSVNKGTSRSQLCSAYELCVLSLHLVTHGHQLLT